MKFFARDRVRFSSGQVNLPNSTQSKPYEYFPDSLFNSGFVPATDTDAGSPIVAQWFNALFRTISYHCPTSGVGANIPGVGFGRESGETGNCIAVLVLLDNAEAAIYVGSRTTKWVRVAGTPGAPTFTNHTNAEGSTQLSKSCHWFMISSSGTGY